MQQEGGKGKVTATKVATPIKGEQNFVTNLTAIYFGKRKSINLNEKKTETELKTSTAMLRQAMIFDGLLLFNFDFFSLETSELSRAKNAFNVLRREAHNFCVTFYLSIV